MMLENLLEMLWEQRLFRIKTKVICMLSHCTTMRKWDYLNRRLRKLKDGGPGAVRP